MKEDEKKVWPEAYMDVRIFWDKSMGPLWMNLDNLKLVMFSDQCIGGVARERVAVAEQFHSEASGMDLDEIAAVQLRESANEILHSKNLNLLIFE